MPYKDPIVKRERHRLYKRRRQQADPGWWRNTYLNSKYGITTAEYDRLLKRQGGKCAICRVVPKRIRLHVDHCHKTGRVRGLLCVGCNAGIGSLRDDPKIVLRAAKYLGRPTR